MWDRRCNFFAEKFTFMIEISGNSLLPDSFKQFQFFTLHVFTVQAERDGVRKNTFRGYQSTLVHFFSVKMSV